MTKPVNSIQFSQRLVGGVKQEITMSDTKSRQIWKGTMDPVQFLTSMKHKNWNTPLSLQNPPAHPNITSQLSLSLALTDREPDGGEVIRLTMVNFTKQSDVDDVIRQLNREEMPVQLPLDNSAETPGEPPVELPQNDVTAPQNQVPVPAPVSKKSSFLKKAVVGLIGFSIVAGMSYAGLAHFGRLPNWAPRLL
jgi:hypothetical protein